jgi:hypothetical protein
MDKSSPLFTMSVNEQLLMALALFGPEDTSVPSGKIMMFFTVSPPSTQ